MQVKGRSGTRAPLTVVWTGVQASFTHFYNGSQTTVFLRGRIGRKCQDQVLRETTVIEWCGSFPTGTTGTGRSDSAATQNLPPVEASDLVSFLVLETSFVTAKQFKAHKSMEAYNQFVSGWVKDVSGWTVSQKIVVTGRVSYHT